MSLTPDQISALVDTQYDPEKATTHLFNAGVKSVLIDGLTYYKAEALHDLKKNTLGQKVKKVKKLIDLIEYINNI